MDSKILKKVASVGAKLLVTALVFSFIFNQIDFEDLQTHIVGADLRFIFLSFCTMVLSFYFSGLRSRYYFHSLGLSMTRAFSICLYFLGMLFNIILPGGISGDGYRVYFLWKKEKFKKLLALRIILYERTNGFYILVLLGLIFCLYSDFIDIEYLKEFTFLCLIAITPCYFLGAVYILRDKFNTAVLAIGYSFIIQGLQVISCAILVYAIAPDADFQFYINYIFLFIVASIVIIFPISIGGAGLRELTFLYGIQYLGGDVRIAVSFAMLTFIVYVFASLIGLPVYFKINGVKRLE